MSRAQIDEPKNIMYIREHHESQNMAEKIESKLTKYKQIYLDRDLSLL